MEKYQWLNKHSRLFLERGYLQDGVTPEQRIRQVAEAAESYLKIDGFADKFEGYMEQGYYSLATPVWNNFGNQRGLPVSCFGSYISDTMESILSKVGEVGIMSKQGGGTSAYFGGLRGRGEKISVGGESSGPVHFMELFDTVANVVSQGCYDDKTEILTENGWKFFEDVVRDKSLKVAQIDDDNLVTFVAPSNYFKYFVNEDLVLFKDSKNIDLLVTKNHNMVFRNRKRESNKRGENGKLLYHNKFIEREFSFKDAENCPCHRDIMFYNSGFAEEGEGLSWEDKFLIALQADGSIVRKTNTSYTFHFSKVRKINRLKEILSHLDYKFSENLNKDGTTAFYINANKTFSKTFDWVKIRDVNKKWAEEFILELFEWDGSKEKVEGNGTYSSILKINADTVQAIAALCGYKSKTKKDNREKEPTKRPIYYVYLSKGEKFGVEKLDKKLEKYEGFVYCVEVPSHKIIIRRGGHTLVCGNSARRGSFAAYLPIEHPDIEEFLQIRSEGHPIQNMSIGVTISDDWMKALIDGDKDKRKIWAKVIQKRFESGYPYIMFSDTVNKNAPQVYKDKGLKIKASNLCVAPETLLLTKSGHRRIKDLAGCDVEIWNGKQYSLARCEKTGENQPLIQVILKDGSALECTPYHKFYVSLDNWEIGSSGYKESEIVEIRAIDLKSGDKIHKYNINYTNGYQHLELVEVQQTIDYGRKDDTYCVNEPLEHKAVFNGILTGNCSEIELASDEKNSFVCVLSSLNLLHWDEMKDTDAIETLIYFLDAVNEEFINKTTGMKFMETAWNFAKTQRALGLGALGWHSYLQSKMIPFESMEAKLLNSQIWATIRKKADLATCELAKMFGEPELLEGYGRRNVTTLAVAPTTSSSFILGQVSPSIEPLNSNYFVKKLAKGSFTYKNPYLRKVLKEKDQDTDEVWKSILVKGGSAKHLNFLSENEKDVFKTFGEISQKEIVIQASQRQKFIDQSQSLNLMVPLDTKPKEVSELLIEGWKLGVKTFYYQRSANPSQELGRSILACASCEA